MDLKQLDVFVQVVNERSFSKAAQKLYLTQPTVSAHIKSLENELQSKLFLRTYKEVLPTESGLLLYDYARDMLQLRDNALRLFLPDGKRKERLLTIGASTIPAQYVLPNILPAFRKCESDVSFHVLRCDSKKVVQYLLERKAEIGFTGTIIPSKHCRYEPFWNDRLVVITPAHGKFDQMATWDPALFRTEPFILRESGSGTRKETERYFESIGIDIAHLPVAATMDDPESIKHSVSEGLGISILSLEAVAAFERVGLVRAFPIDHPSLFRKLYMVTLEKQALSPAAAGLMAFVRAQYGEACAHTRG